MMRGSWVVPSVSLLLLSFGGLAWSAQEVDHHVDSDGDDYGGDHYGGGDSPHYEEDDGLCTCDTQHLHGTSPRARIAAHDR